MCASSCIRCDVLTIDDCEMCRTSEADDMGYEKTSR